MSDVQLEEKHILDLIRRNLDEAIENHSQRMAYMFSKLETKEPIVVGSVNFKEPQKYTQTYETAAWYTTYKIKEGDYSVHASTNYYNKSSLNTFYEAEGVVIEDYTQSLYGGVPIGKSVDKSDNPEIGKKRMLNNGIEDIHEKLIDGTLNITDTRIAILVQNISDRTYPVFVLNPNHPEMKQKIDEQKSKSEHYYSDIYSELSYLIKENSNEKVKKIFQRNEKIEGKSLYEIIKSEMTKPEIKERVEQEISKKIDANINEINEKIKNSPYMKYHKGEDVQQKSKVKNKPQ